MEKVVYLIDNITDYGKLMAFCIHNNIYVFRTYWDEPIKDICYEINWKEKCCYYCNKKYYQDRGYTIVKPVFDLDDYGNYVILNSSSKKVFTEDEKAVFKSCPNLKWAARDENGDLYFYHEKPTRDNANGYWVQDVYLDAKRLTDKPFNAIMWDDKEPTGREEILGE